MYEEIKFIVKTFVVSGCVVGFVAILYNIHNKLSKWLKKDTNKNKDNKK